MANRTALFCSLFLLLLAGELFGQATPSSWTTNYRFRCYAAGVNPGADSLNQNWKDIDWEIYRRGWKLGASKVYPITQGWAVHLRTLAGDTTGTQLLNVAGTAGISSALLVDTLKSFTNSASVGLWIGRTDTAWTKIYRDSTIFYAGGTNVAKFAKGWMRFFGDSVMMGPLTQPIQATTAGRQYLSLQGSTGRGVVELSTAEADADGIGIGNYSFADKNGTGATKVIAQIVGVLSGTTATNRGGYLQFQTKIDGGTITQAGRITNAQQWILGTHLTANAKLDIISTTEQLRLGYDANNRLSVTQEGTNGPVTFAGTGDWVFNMTGKDIYPYTNYDQNLGTLTNKYRTIHAAELWLQTLVADNVLATVGAHVFTIPTTWLVADITADSVYIQTKHNNLDSLDKVMMNASGKFEFMTIKSPAIANGSTYRYLVERNADTTGVNVWYAGDAVVSTGVTGNGWIDQYAVRGMRDERTGAQTEYGPTIVGNVRTDTSWNAWSPRWAIGNLNGLYGYSSDTYGAAFGSPSAAWVKIDPTNGVRIGHNTTTFAQITAAGTASFTGSITVTGGNAATTDDVAAKADTSLSDVTGTLTTNVIPAKAVSPGGAGLYLGSNYMGYYSGAAWTAYIDNTGLFASQNTSDGNTTILSSTGSYALAAGPTGSPTFTLTHAGALTATSAAIVGNIRTGAVNYIDLGYTTSTRVAFYQSSALMGRIWGESDVLAIDAAAGKSVTLQVDGSVYAQASAATGLHFIQGFSTGVSTLVTDLNADLLDGNEATAFAAASHAHAAADVTSGTFNVARIPVLDYTKMTGYTGDWDSGVDILHFQNGILTGIN